MPYFPSENWLEQVKSIAYEIMRSRQFVLEGVVTSVNQNAPYAVKVNLEPYGIETGWLKIAAPYAGDGYGFISPAPAEGTQVKVIFDMGDIRNGTVIAGMFSQAGTPTVPYGTVGLIDPNGTQITIDPDGNASLQAAAGNKVVANQDGSGGVYNAAGKGITVAADGTVTINGKTITESW